MLEEMITVGLSIQCTKAPALKYSICFQEGAFRKLITGTLASLELFSTCNSSELEIPFFMAPALFHNKNYYTEVIPFKTDTMGFT